MWQDNKYKYSVKDGFFIIEHIKIGSKRRRSRNRRWKKVIEYFRGRCGYCLKIPTSSIGITKDHFIPVSKGGSNGFSNLVPACEVCNNNKKNIHPIKWCTEEQLERIYTYFWDRKIRQHHIAVQWKALGICETIP